MVEEVVKALVGLADAMRVEAVRRSSYHGEDWERDGYIEIQAVKMRRQVFEHSLAEFVKRMVSA